ncbi:MAG TPA: cytochrome c [Aestuariivirga sp.]|jgi:cytochrome c556|nr:cytochrome c [Aestuariivirga sp.]
MLRSFAKATAIIGLSVTLGAGVALAGPDEAIKLRQENFKTIGKAMKEMGGMAKGEVAFDLAKVKEQLGIMQAAFKSNKDNQVFAPENQTGTVETWAKPEIWTNPEGVAAASSKLGSALKVMSEVTDEAGFKTAFQDLGGACKGCHDDFRRPKDQ